MDHSIKSEIVSRIKLDTSFIFNSINFTISKYDKCSIDHVMMLQNNNTRIKIPDEVLMMIGYPGCTLTLRYDIDPSGELQFPKKYTEKKGYFTIKDILKKIMDFYNKKHSKDEINVINSHISSDLNEHSLGQERRLYLKKRTFQGIRYTEDIDTFEVNFI